MEVRRQGPREEGVYLAIPLRALMSMSGRDLTWGFHVIRSRRADLKASYWHGPLEASCRISQYGEIRGLELEQGGAKRWEMIPYVPGLGFGVVGGTLIGYTRRAYPAFRSRAREKQ